MIGAVFLAVTGLLWGWMYRKILVDGLAYKLRPDPQVPFHLTGRCVGAANRQCAGF